MAQLHLLSFLVLCFTICSNLLTPVLTQMATDAINITGKDVFGATIVTGEASPFDLATVIPAASYTKSPRPGVLVLSPAMCCVLVSIRLVLVNGLQGMAGDGFWDKMGQREGQGPGISREVRRRLVACTSGSRKSMREVGGRRGCSQCSSTDCLPCR